MNLISIIIPIYNAEKYLRKCIHSIINQTYKNLEIILVDDGSTDNSLNICNEYSKKDNRIVVLHKKNDGVSSARNYGLKHSTGDYIGFVDPDDYIESTMYEKLLNSLIEEHTRISMCGYTEIKNDKKINTFIYNEKIISNERLLSDIFNDIFIGSVWNKLFEKKLFTNDNNLILFNESVHYCEDTLMLISILKNSDKISICNESLYNYILIENSLSHNNISERKLTIINSLELIIKECECNFKNLVDLAEMSSINHKIGILIEVEESSLKNKDNYICTLKDDIKKKLKYCNTRIKLKAFLALYFTDIYIILKKIKRRL